MSKEENTKTKLQLIELVKMYHGRNMSISSISEIIKISTEEVESILHLISDEFDADEQLVASVNSYDIMIADLNLLISKIQDPSLMRDADSKTIKRYQKQQSKLPEYFKQRKELVEAKVKLLQSLKGEMFKNKDEKVWSYFNKYWNSVEYDKLNSDIINWILSYEFKVPKDITERKVADEFYKEVRKVLRPKQVTQKTFSEKFWETKTGNVFVYRVLGLLNTWGYNRKTIEDIKEDDKKLIRQSIGCTNKELKGALRLIRKNRIPAPKDDIQIKLRKMWKYS